MRIKLAALAFLTLVLAASTAEPCTNFLVTRGASQDGSTMITYAADSHSLYGELYFRPAAKYPAGTMLRIYEWDTGTYLGEIPQAEETYSVVGNINQFQVAIGETTYGGRKELINPKGIIDYGSLMYIALQRSKTAREAINVMIDLVDKHGYYSSGEAFSISDPKEVWFMVIIGKGEGSKGVNWVAQRVPDGYVSAHANYSRVRQFPFNDPENCMYNKDIVDFARAKGWFDGPDKEFSYSDAFAPLTWAQARSCEARVYSFFRAVAPSANIKANFVDGTIEDVRLPLWIKPDRKLGARDLMDLMRDHFEGTPIDMHKGVGAGPYVMPYRWRPMRWEYKGQMYVHDRSTATQQTGFSFVAQSRGWLPDPVGGILWFGVDDTASTVYVPMYCGITAAPHPFAVGNGNFSTFSWEAAFWVFNVVSNWAYTRYSDISKEIRIAQNELEGLFTASQPEVDAMATALYKQAPGLARQYLTDYSASRANQTIAKWQGLAVSLFMKYMDGNVRDEKGIPQHPAYDEQWYKAIVEQEPELYKLRKFDWEIQEEKRLEEEKKKKESEQTPR